MAELLGALTSWWVFSYVIRNTVFRNNKKKNTWIYSAVILIIVAPVMSGIGDADGGVFSIEAALLQIFVGLFYIVVFIIYSLIGNSTVESTDFGNDHKEMGGRIFLVVTSVIVYGLFASTAFLSVREIQTNKNLFDFNLTANNISESQEAVRALLEFVEETNKTTPSMLDKSTRLDKVYLSGYDLMDMNWRYTIIDYDSPMRSYNFDKINADMISRICSIEDYKFIFEGGVSYNYVYHDNSGSEINRVRVDKKICKNQLNSASH